jgi:hypothetical protein
VKNARFRDYPTPRISELTETPKPISSEQIERANRELGVSTSWGLLYRGLCAVVLFGVAVFWGFSSPNGFLKCANLVTVDRLPELNAGANTRYADPASLLGDIPYDEYAESPWLIEPDRRLELVFERGLGNCAYLSRGLARRLQLDGIPYNVIWLMDRNDTRSGSGHTVVECPVRVDSVEGNGIIDMLEGGVPVSTDGNLVTRAELLTHAAIEGLRIRSFNERKDDESAYYGPWMSSTVLGITTSEELNRYFNLLKVFYVDFGYSRIEKLIYNLGAITLGLFPTVYITPDELRRFDGFFQFEIAMARVMIWCVRALIFMATIDIALRLGGLILRARRTHAGR